MNVTLGKSIRDKIKQSGIPVPEVGRMIDLSEKALRSRLSGKIPFLCDELVRIALLLDISLRDLMACIDHDAERAA
ncbi:hypothetical protein [Rhodococcus sp. NPDC055024]